MCKVPNPSLLYPAHRELVTPHSVFRRKEHRRGFICWSPKQHTLPRCWLRDSSSSNTLTTVLNIMYCKFTKNSSFLLSNDVGFSLILLGFFFHCGVMLWWVHVSLYKMWNHRQIQMSGYSWYIRVNIGFHGTGMCWEPSLLLNTPRILYIIFSVKRRLLPIFDCHKKNAVITNGNQTIKINHDLGLFLIAIIFKVTV